MDKAEKQILFCWGEKGGVGKSTIFVLLLDYLVRTGRTVYVVEAEAAQTLKAQTVARRCGISDKFMHIDALNEKRFRDMLTPVEKLPSNAIVLVDFGAGTQRPALQLLPGWLYATEQMGAHMRIAYVLTAEVEGAQAVKGAIEGLRAAGRPVDILYVLNDHNARSSSDYPILQSSKFADRFPEFAAAPKIWAGPLPPVLTECISECGLLPSTGVDSDKLSLASRGLLAGLYPRIDSIARQVLGEAEPEPLPADSGDEDFEL